MLDKFDETFTFARAIDMETCGRQRDWGYEKEFAAPPQARSGRCGQMCNAAVFLDFSCWLASPCDFLEVLDSGKPVRYPVPTRNWASLQWPSGITGLFDP
jgi:hypothetical protein